MNKDKNGQSGHTGFGLKKNLNKKATLISLIIVVALVGAGLWLNQAYVKANNRIVSAENQQKTLNKEKIALKKERDELFAESQRQKAELEKLNRSIAELTNNKTMLPGLKIIEAKHFNGSSGEIIIDGINDFVLIKAQVVNNSQKDSYFSIADLKLKDTNNSSYQYFTEASVTGWSGPTIGSGASFLPNGYAEIKSQTLKPGEQLSGGLIFVAPKNIKSFKLLYNDSSFDIKL